MDTLTGLLEALSSAVLQVRVALKDWEDIQAFERDAGEAQHLDVVYILRQLMRQKGFHFAAMPTLVIVAFLPQEAG